jgi:hypothetical protein
MAKKPNNGEYVALMNVLICLLEKGDAASKKQARKELLLIAEITDSYKNNIGLLENALAYPQLRLLENEIRKMPK